MRFLVSALCIALFTLMLVAGAQAQSGRSRQSGVDDRRNRSDSAQPDNSKPGGDDKDEATDGRQQAEVVKVETNLVTVPVIVSNRSGTYIPDMKQDEFTIFEDGVEQKLVFFATVSELFHVVLMIDTSASTQEKLGQIERAAIAFIEQLQPADRVKIVSFDDRIRELGDFTNDRALLAASIQQLRAGRGTKLYDAMDVALKSLGKVKGRKAVVIFTDGVDWHSDRKRLEDNFRAIEESGVILYPIRYETREETERLARAQASSGQVIDLGSIFGGGVPSTTPGSIRLPGSVVISRGPTERTTGGTTGPDATSRYPDPRNDPLAGNPTPQQRGDDQIRTMLDAAYSLADSYLSDLADKSGGRLLRADTLGSLPDAFARVAAELRTQYSLGYYPPKTSHDGKFHKIQVRTTRRNVSVRARPGYRSP